MEEQNTIQAPGPKEKKPLSTNPESVRRREYRQRKRDEKIAALPPEPRQKKIKAQWEKNRAALSVTERKKLDDHISEWNYIVMLCLDDSRRIRNGSTEDGPSFCPEQDFAEIEAFAKRFPPTDGRESYHTFFEDHERRIENEPFYFRTYGQGVDSIDHVFYYEFIHCFGDWYTENRNKLALATTTEYGPEYAKTWDEIDTLVEANRRLNWRCSRAKGQREIKSAPASQAPQPEPDPIQKTLNDLHQAGLGATSL